MMAVKQGRVAASRGRCGLEPRRGRVSKASLTFLGGAGTVTGSRHLLGRGGRSLMADCGLFPGLRPLRLKDWAPS